MTAFDLLGVAIGVIFVFLLLSLICTALYELIEAFLRRRATDLEQGLREMLNDKKGEHIVKDLYNHPLIMSLYKGTYNAKKTRNLPSYIPASNFAMALLAVLPPNDTSAHTEARRGKAEDPSKAYVQSALQPLMQAAAGDMQQQHENIKAWYDSVMDRVSGGYKRRAQIWLAFIGLALTVAVNADAIAIASSIASDTQLREALVEASAAYAQAPQTASTTPTPDLNSTIEDCKLDAKSPECRIQRNLEQLRELGVPLGWDTANPRSVPTSGVAWLSKVLGWLCTALAISLGAPFWFDVLNKFLVIRSTVKPKEKSPEEGSEDGQQLLLPVAQPRSRGPYAATTARRLPRA